MTKLAALVSGGVDSSVALSLLKKEGKYDITAFYLKIWLEDELQFLGDCPWEEDLRYAQAVCDQLGIPLEVVSLQSQYWDRVVSQTVSELKKGHTPSPDILCNQRVKFGAFVDLIDAGYERIASGHYAQIKQDDKGISWLVKGADPVKDQTYFLSQLSQSQLARCVFPVGAYPKADVRVMAKQLALANESRPDSQGICFLGKIKFNDFVKYHLGEKQGSIVDQQTGKVLGKHKGFWFHTIGQRRGLGLSGGPWFVVDKDCSENVIYVSSFESFAAKPQLCFEVDHAHWISNAPAEDAQLSVKIRHGSRVNGAKLTYLGEKKYRVDLEQPDGGVAAGQYAVFYHGEICLGSAMISRRLSN
jgi:tRNA (5-methylaminomethyl-2-thiouridylate)-methyltransferase